MVAVVVGAAVTWASAAVAVVSAMLVLGVRLRPPS